MTNTISQSERWKQHADQWEQRTRLTANQNAGNSTLTNRSSEQGSLLLITCVLSAVQVEIELARETHLSTPTDGAPSKGLSELRLVTSCSVINFRLRVASIF